MRTHKIAVLGYGREGRSLYGFLKKRSAKNREIWVLDKKSDIPLPRSVKRQCGENYLADLTRFETIFRSPGVPLHQPELKKAVRAGVKVSSATRLFFEAATKTGATLVGVTGSKGKTTTSTLLYEMLRAGKKKVFLAGNIGVPMLDLLPKLDAKSIVILELSSFQLQDLERSPKYAVILDVFPEHQDAHANLKEYYDAKGNIARMQKKTDTVFYFIHNPVTQRLAAAGRGKKVKVTEKGFSLFSPPELRIRGPHGFRNAIMAATVARTLGVADETIRRTALEFKGVEHRLEFVMEIPGRHGTVAFYNDSASTNPMSSASAIEAFAGTPHILIAGGYDKNLDYAPLSSALRKAGTKLVILFGSNRTKVNAAVLKAHIPSCFASNLEEALLVAVRTALDSPSSTAIILSPGAASFDMFDNYAARGLAFKDLVGKIPARR
jgi:UDP-N-acetylmuramoylalanine--D-glutamate ligase